MLRRDRGESTLNVAVSSSAYTSSGSAQPFLVLLQLRGKSFPHDFGLRLARLPRGLLQLLLETEEAKRISTDGAQSPNHLWTITPHETVEDAERCTLGAC